MSYTIPLDQQRVKPHQSTALHFMVAIVLFGVGIVSGVAFWFFAVSPTVRQVHAPLAIFGTLCFLAGIAIAAVTIKGAHKRGLRRALRLLELILLAAGVAIFAANGMWIPAVLFGVLGATVLLALFGEGGNAEMAVYFDESGIRRPFAVKSRQIPWHEVARVLLRHDTLTIDLSDNRLFQYRTGNHGVDTASFEVWTAEQVKTGTANKPKSDW
jgi:hypothetical protein